MKNSCLFLCSLLLLELVNGQTLSEIQMRNARASGYAIVAARNPGVSFSVLMIPWDGVNTLEYNAQTQINSDWHAQAVVKGNYFNQSFDGEDFSRYSTIILSQAEFDLYKHAGTQWWIVCSILPPFSNSITSSGGNIGIGTASPFDKLTVHGNISLTYGENRYVRIGSATNYYYNLQSTYNDFQIIEAADNNKVRFHISYPNGNIGIGTTTPTEKLSVNGNIKSNGTVTTKKLVVSQTGWPDYVFDSSYSLRSLSEVEKFITQNKRLPEVPSAKEVEEKGVSVGDNQALLLKKIEELTLYLIKQDRRIEDLTIQVKQLKSRSTRTKNKILSTASNN